MRTVESGKPFQLREDFVFWLSNHMAEAGFVSRDIMSLQIITYEPDSWQVNKPTEHFAVLQLQDAYLPPVTVGSGRIAWAHATTEGGLQGILRSRRMMPTTNFYDDQPRPFTSFMCLATHLRGGGHDDGEVARIISKALRHGKNRSNVIVLGVAQGKNTAIDTGGSWEGLLLADTDLTVHIRREHIWAVKTTASRFTGLAFATCAVPGVA